MKAVVQRVLSASVTVDSTITGQIEKGFLVLLGVTGEDEKSHAELLAQKVADLRIFTDDNDKMNLSLKDVRGAALVVSNFTLCADVKKGNRPSFTLAKEPGAANDLYEYFCECLKYRGITVQNGVFGADMKVSMLGDGPVTILLDTDIWMK